MERGFRYPAATPADWEPYWRLPLHERIAVAVRNARRWRRAKGIDRDARLTPVRTVARPLAPDAVVLVACVRNVAPHLTLFLDHYRALGVARFAMVDNASTDGTREALEAADDVDLYTSALDYGDSRRGAIWRDGLLARYGLGRWYLLVDADEFLLYPECDTRPVGCYVADLEAAGLARGMAAMLDIYPDGPVAAARPEAAESLAALAPLIDGDGYGLWTRRYGNALTGGPRHRVFGSKVNLTKFPLLRADGRTRLVGTNIHVPFPYARNFQAPSSVLLHLRFTAQSVGDFADIIARGQHSGGAKSYRAMMDGGFDAATDLRYPGSMRWESAAVLEKAGFLSDVRDRGTAARGR